MNNIIEIVENDKNLDILCKTVKASGLETEFKNNGPYTIFAPTDMAFGKINSEKLQMLLKPENKLKLTDLLKNHVIKGKTNLDEMKDGQKFQTLGGKELEVKIVDGKTIINGTVIKDNVPASNGYIHHMDALFNLS
ncbi:MAG: fasciclin domain-containing protein [Ferruginibacter sp.]